MPYTKQLAAIFFFFYYNTLKKSLLNLLHYCFCCFYVLVFFLSPVGRTDVEAETAILWPPDAKGWLIWKDHDWRREEKGKTGWDGWMTSPTQWTWVWVNSGSWWWTGRPGVLWFVGWQRVRHDWATELNRGTLASRPGIEPSPPALDYQGSPYSYFLI